MAAAAAAKSSSILRRSLLYVPASSHKMLVKSLGLTADNVTYDLEDSVIPDLKHRARAQLKTHLASIESRPESISELAVRINAVSTPFALDDLTSLVSSPLVDAVVVPKVEAAADLTFVSDVLRHVAPQRHADDSTNPIKIIALIESARAVMDLATICRASPFLSGLIFAAEDFALDLSITRSKGLQEFLYARSAIVTAARAAALPSAIDLVCTDYQGEQGLKTLEAECQAGKAMGFSGKQCIHPGQLAHVHKYFAPSEEEVEWALGLLAANEEAVLSGKGAWSFQGKMIDAPVIAKARSIVAKAEQCHFDVTAMKKKWQQ